MTAPAIQRFVDIPVGRIITNASRIELGEFDERNPGSQFRLRQIRVGLAVQPPLYVIGQPPPAIVRYTAMLTVPGGQEIGPIDLPFRFNVELPVNMSFTTDNAATFNQQIMCTAHDLPDSPDIWGATYFVVDATVQGEAPLSAYQPIYPWVQGVTVFSGSTAQFLDIAGNTIATFTGPQIVARPRMAAYISSSGQSVNPVLFHY